MSKKKHSKHDRSDDANAGTEVEARAVVSIPPAEVLGGSPPKMKNKEYQHELRRLHGELVAMQEWVKASGSKVCVVFEGRDTAGKGGTIKAITERVSPRVFRVVALPAPTDRQKSQMYVQRYIEHFPAAGEVVIFDRSWYNRAGVERVMGFATSEQVKRFLDVAPAVEKAMTDSGIVLVKYWLEVSPDEQTRRLESRIDDPRKTWKLSEMDLISYQKWDEYSRARDEMFAATDTAWAPWFIAHSDDKKRARLNVITHLLGQVPYQAPPAKKIRLPDRKIRDTGATAADAVYPDAVLMGRRLAALAALIASLAAVTVTVVALRGDGLRLVVAVALVLVTSIGAWYAVTRRHALRMVGRAVAVLGVVALVTITLTGESTGLVIAAVLGLIGVSSVAARYALGRDAASLLELPTPGTPVGPATHGVLIINPKSGGGKGERFRLVDEARRRGIEPVVLEPGIDLLALAEDAVRRGADVIGMAGGDGSQALVASVATRHDVAHVCVPAGTRNHFALDLGLDRDDVVGALDAFGAARERRIDLATVGDRVFVNNVSLGVYAKIVQSPEYRDAKRQTAAAMLPDLLGQGESPFSLRFTGPDGEPMHSVPLVLVSNNPYTLTRRAGFGTRARLDTGELGVSTVEVGGATDVAAFVTAEATGQLARYSGFREWTTPEFTVDSDEPIEAGVDGEALKLDAPLKFRSLPAALRVRIPEHAPGWSPAALASPSVMWTVSALLHVIGTGRPPAIDERLR